MCDFSNHFISDTILSSKIVGDLKIENDTINFGGVLVGTTVPDKF